MANEKRLIDANELDSKLDALAKKYAKHGRFEAAKDYSFVQTVLLTAPTVDAVEVVRCKDCKHYHPRCQSVHWQGKKNMCCRSANVHTKPDDFCSYGERKDNGC